MAATVVGGAFLSATIQIIAERLTSSEFRVFIRNTKFNYSLLEELKTILSALQAVLVDAEQKQFKDPHVKQWLEDLKDALFDAEDLLNLITYDALQCKVENTPVDQQKYLPSKSININSKMERMCRRLQTFVQLKDILRLQRTVSGRSRDSHRTPSCSVVNESVVVGRKDDKNTVINMLVSDCGTSRNNNLGVVAILGMGGVGKTTLAQFVYNDKKVQEHFDCKAWVCVSEDFDVVRVTKSLLESVVRNTTSSASKVWESDNLDILRVELKKRSREKRFLFVLDDLWNDNYNDWDELVSPLIDGKPGSSVIITTRQQKVAVMAHTFPIHKLDPLSQEECWSLLSKHALGSDDFHECKNTGLEEIGRKIARKCGGLPIAAKTLGGLLRSRVNKREWTSILNSNVWNLPNDNIMPALHLSYHYLPSYLKRCFAYCSIFPKDYPLDRKKLVLLWMAEGFLDCSQGGKSAEELGDDCFAELLSRSLIQQSNDDARGKLFFMHELLNDLATVVSGKSCSRFESGDMSEKVRYMSYNQEGYDTLAKFPTHFKCLRSFLPIYYWRLHIYLSMKVVDDLLPSLKWLRVLSLSEYTNITKLPDSVGNLKQLRYLDLSSTKIQSLPDTVCKLYNLQSLILLGCVCLTELPVHMGNLISLRHLDISGTDIKELPKEICGLENLQTLTVFVVGKRQVGLSIKELKNFPHLRGKLTIKNLHNVIDAKEARDANLKNKEKIEELELLWGKHSEDSVKVKIMLDMLQPSMNLKSLKIDLYGGTRFPNWLGDSSFSNMVSLCISNCEYCVTLPPLGQLASLKDLEIYGMKMLETIGPEFYRVQVGESSISSFQPFPSLELMKFHDMPNWKEWLSFEGSNFAFPRLKTLELHKCPELRRHFPSHLYSIEEIEIEGCGHLLETQPTMHWLLSIKEIKIRGDLNFEGLPERIQWPLLESDSPCLLQSVAIDSCLTLLSLPKMVMSSSCLQYLHLYQIPSLVSFPKDGLPTSLLSISIHYCPKLAFMPPETWNNYVSLVSLTILSSCDALTSFQLDGFPALEMLHIGYCTSLDSICISESPSCHPTRLQSLEIRSHDSIGLFKVKLTMDMLTSLEHLVLECGELSFSEGVRLPHSLQSIDIQFLKTTPSVREWSLQSLTALSSLSIGGCVDIVNTLLKEPLLPISVVSLTIGYLYEMKSFKGNGLQHLPSLENLHFRNCQQLESFPENYLPSSLKSLQFWFCPRLESLPEERLPDSLELLVISRCPALEERYKRKEHWSKIAHIPVIEIDGHVTI